MKPDISRRHFLQSASLAGASLSLASFAGSTQGAENTASLSKPAMLGGKPACSNGFPGWPVFNETEEKALLDTLHSGQWYRGSGKAVAQFEAAYAGLTGAKHCLAT